MKFTELSIWRIGWFERLFFKTCRLFNAVQQTAFQIKNFGFDVSYYQGILDFMKIKAYGALFVILRCVYAIYPDSKFEDYISEAFGALPVSVYAFYDPVYDPAEQAKRVIAILAPYRSKIKRVWLDLEFWWDGAYKDPKYWKIFRDTIAAAGYQVGWYTRATWWDSRVGNYATEFAHDPCWAAQYNTALTLIPKGWKEAGIQPMIWQDGVVSAIGKNLDHDLWNDVYDFETEWGIAPSTDPNQGESSMKANILAFINIRPAAGDLSQDLGDLNQGDVILYDKTQNVTAGNFTGDWYHITGITRTDGTSIVAPANWWCWGKNVQPIAAQTLPYTIEDTVVLKDDLGNVMGTYTGILTKQ